MTSFFYFIYRKNLPRIEELYIYLITFSKVLDGINKVTVKLSNSIDNMEKVMVKLIKNIKGYLAFSKDMKSAFNKVEGVNAENMVSSIFVGFHRQRKRLMKLSHKASFSSWLYPGHGWKIIHPPGSPA